MGRWIGMDEAGLGPNLGPFVVAATVWEFPELPGDCDFWTRFRDVVSHDDARTSDRLYVADSKQVYSPQTGRVRLDSGVKALFELAGLRSETWCDQLAELRSHQNASQLTEAWWQPDFQVWSDREFLTNVNALGAAWRAVCHQAEIRVRVSADVVSVPRFNDLLDRFDNKSAACSHVAMELLRSIWDPERDGPTHIVADKHGGRNRYAALLADAFPNSLVACREESAARSVYRLGDGQISFQPRAEEHGPVALASMTAKWLRETAMEQFNAYWRDRVPNIKPTAGYPVDAKRFLRDLSASLPSEQLDLRSLWRNR